QAVYARAGFFYDYASSREIFAGVSGFRRVRKAQAGDLVVWQGHMGIVIDPREHSFYSSVLSGFAIENYQSNYWLRKNGNPRFYRFVVNFWPDAPWPVPSNLAQVGLASNEVVLRVIQPSPASGKSPALIATARPRVSGLQSARIETEPKAKANVSPQIKTQASAQTNANAPTKASAPSPIGAESSVQIQAPASAQKKPDSSGQLKAEAKANVSPQIKTQASAQAKPSAPSPITAGSVQIQAPASAQMKPEASGQMKAEASG